MHTGLYNLTDAELEEIFSKMSFIDYPTLYDDLRQGYHLAELGECPYSDTGAFFDLIKMCTHQPLKLLRDDVWVELDKHSTITDYRELAEIWRWSLKKTYSFIQWLQDDGILQVKSSDFGTVISLK